jgi:hypothetical protein
MTCETCAHFAKGKSSGGADIVMGYALAGRVPPVSAMTASILADKDGQCRFMPQPVAKQKTDICGHHAPIAMPEGGR